MNLCKTCQCRCEKEYCFHCKPRKKIPQIRRFKTLSLRDNGKTTESVKSSLLMKEFFLEVWNERLHYSELSNTFLGKEILTIYFHHILPKEKFPQAKFDRDNIILLLLDEHGTVELNMYKYEEINRRRKLLLSKYEIEL